MEFFRQTLFNNNMNIPMNIQPVPSMIKHLPEFQYQRIPVTRFSLLQAVGFHLGRDAHFVRNIIARNLEENRIQYESTVNGLCRNNQSFEVYVSEIRNGTGGENIGVLLLMQLINRAILVMKADGSIENRDSIDVYPEGEPVFVFHNSGNHYDALIRKSECTGRQILDQLTQFLELHSESATNQINLDESEEAYLNSRKVFFQDEGIASKTRDNLLQLLLSVYKQSPFLETFSVLKIQRCLDKLQSDLNRQEVVESLVTIGNVNARKTQLESLEMRFNTLLGEVQQHHVQFNTSDAMVQTWFARVFETVTKLSEAIKLQKDILIMKSEKTSTMQHVIIEEETIEGAKTHLLPITQELTDFVCESHFNAENVYADLESLTEFVLINIQNVIVANS